MIAKFTKSSQHLNKLTYTCNSDSKNKRMVAGISPLIPPPSILKNCNVVLILGWIVGRSLRNCCLHIMLPILIFAIVHNRRNNY